MNVEVTKTLTLEELTTEIKKAVYEATSNLRHENEELKATIEELKAKVEGNYERIIDIDNSLTDKITNIDNKVSEIADNYGFLDNRIIDLDDKVSEFTDNYDDLDNKIIDLDNRIDGLDNRIDEVEETMEENNVDFDHRLAILEGNDASEEYITEIAENCIKEYVKATCTEIINAL